MVERLSHSNRGPLVLKAVKNGGTMDNSELVTPHGLSFSGS